MLRSIRRKQTQAKGYHDTTLDYVTNHLGHRDQLFNQALQSKTQGPDAFFRRAEEMLAEYPDHPDTYVILLEAARGMYYLAMWVRACRSLVTRWPDHSMAEAVRNVLVEGERMVAEHPTPIELGEQHEWMMWYLSQGRNQEARDLAFQVLQRHPQDIPTLNNLCLAQRMEFELTGAIATASQVLNCSPGNVHALSNLVMLHILSGKVVEAEEFAAQLKLSSEKGHQHWTKRAEAFTYLGDDQAVLECHRMNRDESPYLNHLAAVALAGRGSWTEAKRLWKGCTQLAEARANLENALRPAAGRHCPWAFSLTQWVNTNLFNTGSDRALLQKIPEILELAPLLLERGDPLACEFLIRLAAGTGHPALLEALQEFGSSQRGSDSLRLKALVVCRQHGVLAPEPVEVWQNGKAQELSLLSWDIHWEDSEKLPKKAEKLRAQGVLALKQGRFRKAETCFTAGLELVPESRALRNNLAAANFRQGRETQALERLRSLVKQYPDYAHARITLASIHARDGQYESARAMIDPVMKSPRLNVTEFACLCEFQLQMIELERKPRSAATAWKNLWNALEKQEPQAAHYRPARLSR